MAQEIVNYTNSKSVYLNKNEKFDKEKYIEDLVARLTDWSNDILLYNPDIVKEDRPDLMYMEGDMFLWKTDRIRQLSEYDMYTLRTLLQKRSIQASNNEFRTAIS